MNWKNVLKWGLILAAFVVAWQFVMGFTGWYHDPALSNLFYIVVVADVLVVVLALRATRRDQGYGQQVLSGLLVGVVAGVVIGLGSLVFVTVAFPDAGENIAAMRQQQLTERGMAPEQVTAVVEGIRSASAFRQAVQGFFGTVLTALFASLIAAIFLRRRRVGPVVDEKPSAS